jgi:hypothetical protein
LVVTVGPICTFLLAEGNVFRLRALSQFRQVGLKFFNHVPEALRPQECLHLASPNLVVRAVKLRDMGFDGLLVGRHFSVKNVVSIMHDIYRQDRKEGPLPSVMVYSLLILCNIGKN